MYVHEHGHKKAATRAGTLNAPRQSLWLPDICLHHQQKKQSVRNLFRLFRLTLHPSHLTPNARFVAHRHYGALQGRNKATLEEAMGEIVIEWRRAYGVRPPPMTDTHPHWPLICLDSRYRGLKIPESESLRDTADRVS